MPTFEYRIHPSVGIARMGDSADVFFAGPEAPVDNFVPTLRTIPGRDASKLPGTSAEPFRANDKSLAKQAARFRIFCFQYPDAVAGKRDEHPEKVWEVTKADYDIEWTVTVANRKPASPARAAKLNTPAAETLKTAAAADFKTVREFTGSAGRLDLGSTVLDADGQLLVLGSKGDARPIPGEAAAQTSDLRWKNWEDDAADGPVEAKVKPKPKNKSSKADKGKPRQSARSAWVVINLPNYGPDVRPSVTLYDLALDHAIANTATQAVRKAWMDAPLTFHRNIVPTLKAYVANRYVSAEARKHQTAKTYAGVLSSAPHLANLFKIYLRTPWKTVGHRAENYWGAPPSGKAWKTKDGGMPKLEYLALPELVYGWFVAWAAGTVAPGNPAVFRSNKVLDKPWLLDVAHMDSMNGGSFYPGIETGRDVHNYKRWNADWGATGQHVDIRWAGTDAGQMTENLAVPWQADFVACSGLTAADPREWWPASRPIEVQQATTAFYNWMHTDAGPITAQDLIKKWAQLGFVRHDTGSGELREESRLLKHP